MWNQENGTAEIIHIIINDSIRIKPITASVKRDPLLRAEYVAIEEQNNYVWYKN